MNNDELPPDSLVLQALHAIRAEAQRTTQETQKTNQRLDTLTTRVEGTNERLDATNERLEDLRVVTVNGLTELNRKVDGNTTAINRLTSETHELNERFDHFLTGQGAKLVKRVDELEAEVRRIANKLDH